jgi:hypothetical protein
VTYFEAKRAEKAFREYRDLALRYWQAKPTVEYTGHEWMSGRRPNPESVESTDARRHLSERYPQISVFAQNLGVPTTMTSYPAPAIGGPVVTGDLLNCVIDQHLGHSSVSRHEVVDAIDKCIGMAETIQTHLFWRQAANPFYYIIIVLAFLIRTPFLVLQYAGLPEEVEHTVWGHVLKAGLLVILTLVFFHYGLRFTLSDLFTFLK